MYVEDPAGLAAAPALVRRSLSGTTMGTRWSALFHAPEHIDVSMIAAALQHAVDEVDQQMSPWKPDSVVRRLNAAPPGTWIELPDRTFDVVLKALEINAATEGAFDPFVGEPVMAWGFGAAGPVPDAARIKAVRQSWRQGTRAVALDRDGRRMRRQSDIGLDLCGIAKGYGVDRLSEVLGDFGITRHLVAIDGELRAEGLQPGERGWPIAIERPDETARDVAMSIEIADMAVATSGNYRHVRDLDGRKVSHTIDPRTGAPVDNALLSVTVLSDTTMLADALATALMVMGTDAALVFAARHGIAALLIEADENGGQRLRPSGRFAALIGTGVAM